MEDTFFFCITEAVFGWCGIQYLDEHVKKFCQIVSSSEIQLSAQDVIKHGEC
jgi:hypothetical protein